MNSGIYQIRNKINGKVYIGLSTRLDKREKEHFSALQKGNHYNGHLQKSYNQYGKNAFEFSVLEHCPVDELRKREKDWVAKKGSYFRGYNETKGGDGVLGYHPSEEEKARRAASIRKNYREHPERKELHSKRMKDLWKDKKSRERLLSRQRASTSTREYREKVSAVQKLKWANPQYVDEKCRKFLESSRSPQSRKKARASLKETYTDPLLRMQIGAHSRALWKTDEYREKHKVSHSAAMRSPEYKAKAQKISLEHWRDPSYREKVRLGAKRGAQNREKKVLQVETGIIYNSISDAAESLGSKTATAHIIDCCLARRKTAANYHWRYAEDTEDDWCKRRAGWVEANSIKEYKSVLCVETGEVFKSAKYAAEFCGKHASNISHCCNGRQQTCGGYHWKYADVNQ